MHTAEVIRQLYSTGTLKPNLDIIGFQYCCQTILIVTESSIWSSGRKNNLSLQFSYPQYVILNSEMAKLQNVLQLARDRKDIEEYRENKRKTKESTGLSSSQRS